MVEANKGSQCLRGIWEINVVRPHISPPDFFESVQDVIQECVSQVKSGKLPE